MDAIESGFEFSEDSFEGIFGTIDKKYARIGDLGDFREYDASILGIDENYYANIDPNLLIWDDVTRSSDQCITNLLATPDSCIISVATARALGISELGQKIRLTFYEEGNYRNGNISVFTVVGVSGGMPGMWNFRSASIQVNIELGVLLNIGDYCKYMEWGEPNVDEMIVDKILINLVDNSYGRVKEMEALIKETFGTEYKFIIDEVMSTIQFVKSNDQTINDVMQIVLYVSVIISLFGLISSMYSTLLERMYEIGILRAMGLRSSEVRTMLMAESLTVMLAAGGMGTLIGVIIASLLMSTITIITEMPAIIAINWVTLATTFGVSIGIGIIGVFAITWRTRKWRVIDTLRFTW